MRHKCRRGSVGMGKKNQKVQQLRLRMRRSTIEMARILATRHPDGLYGIISDSIGASKEPGGSLQTGVMVLRVPRERYQALSAQTGGHLPAIAARALEAYADRQNWEGRLLAMIERRGEPISQVEDDVPGMCAWSLKGDGFNQCVKDAESGSDFCAEHHAGIVPVEEEVTCSHRDQHTSVQCTRKPLDGGIWCATHHHVGPPPLVR